MKWRNSFLAVILLVSTPNLFAISGTSQVAWPGQPVAASDDWPSNALALINDPARTDGWNPWFSEWPSDVKHFTYKLRNSDDANRLIRLLTNISGKVQIKLNPAREAGPLGFTTGLKPGNGHAAVFSLGSQKQIDDWYGRLRTNAHGVREFGVHRYTNAPAALPPTLTLHVGALSLDLPKLEIPARVTVLADIPAAARKEKPDDPMFKAIDEFVARRAGEQTVPGKPN